MARSDNTSAIGDAQRVDLNTASREQLEQVGGLKGKRSKDLISHRPFRSWGDVEKVPGFSQKMVEDLKSADTTLGGKGRSGGSSTKGSSEDRDRDDHRSSSHDKDRSSSKAAGHGRDDDRSGSRTSSDRDDDSRSGSKESGSEEASLKSREYTDAQGNVHHHTKTYDEQHAGDKR